MAYKLPKSFKPAVLDSEAVDAASLGSSKTQLWHFTFPLDFNVAGFSELELHLPAEPISAPGQVPQMVASFELDGASYRIIEGSVFEAADLINLFPSASDPASLQPGKPFTRSFRICRDILFPAPPTRALPLNPLGRAPRQLAGMRKNFLPIGYQHESFGKAELEAGDKQGRVLRSGSARPSSPRLLPNHGFDLAEWRPKKAAGSATSAAAPSTAEEAARKAAKKEKKEAKRRAEALASSAAPADAAESANKKQRTSSSAEGESKKKKKDKH